MLCYADDLCLISLSSAGMQSLLDICNSYAIEHVLTYNIVTDRTPYILNLNTLNLLDIVFI